MKAVYKSLKELDKAALFSYGISEEILMENAAFGVKELLRQKGLESKKIVIATGGGNNGADGYALARMLPNAVLYIAVDPQSELCVIQYERALSVGVETTKKLDGFEVIIDAVIGSGATRELDKELKTLIETLNELGGVKIAIDTPSGIRDGMGADDTVFRADFTVTMGALKESLLLDYAKDFVGEIVVKDLGLPFEAYTKNFTPSSYLFEESDFNPPHRIKQNCNKGDFGNLCIVCGEMHGASIISAMAAIRFGAGLVFLTSKKDVLAPPQIIISRSLPTKSNALVVGQGLGEAFSDKEILSLIKSVDRCVIDADIFNRDILSDILALDKELILTPHPKEFSRILKSALGVEVEVDEIQRHRFGFAKLFCQKFKDKTLILKGANTIVAKNDKIFVLTFGTPVLAKGGSGDALCGVVGALLSQGYGSFEAAVNAVAAIYLSAKKYSGNDYSFTIEDLTEGLQWI